MQDLESKTKHAFATYAALKSEAVSIIDDSRAGAFFTNPEFFSTVLQPWYDKESAMRNEFQHPSDGLTVPRSDGVYYQGPRADRARLLVNVQDTLIVALNQLYEYVGDTVVSCNGDPLDFKAADLQEQLAKAEYAGEDTTKIQAQADDVFDQQMNRPSRPRQCP